MLHMSSGAQSALQVTIEVNMVVKVAVEIEVEVATAVVVMVLGFGHGKAGLSSAILMNETPLTQLLHNTYGLRDFLT